MNMTDFLNRNIKSKISVYNLKKQWNDIEIHKTFLK